ncbi:DUF4166 domain-containing protein [Pseudarthrobacter sp. J75]|uniref:DUF4166 domain-containing protein n=1 Tax=unclassified Pseudarthrobacter TaxID=2647000 RepID=UPI002E81ADD3|nr:MULTISPECIES: DUF4166 domain-containing protein [unclassified Pseudarthrobacter]MEE2521363.1 DUF4166 domain-containing protein [Pseudarthrobacter sp. J47]MEE2528595.1 DUF4166 domain-containing protein [Pseudarthrobacter sp. J75]
MNHAPAIYPAVLGADFLRLQPQVQDYFSLAPGQGHYGVGEGTFEVVGCRQAWLRPALRIMGREEALFPEYGVNIPFRIENHAHLDPFGRSSLTARREIRFPERTRVFQDTTSLVKASPPDPAGGDRPAGASRLVDYLGRHRRLVTDLDLLVSPEGRLRGVSRASRLFLGALRLPLPGALDAAAYAEQWWDPSAGTSGRHRIHVKVIQPQVGVVLVYAGSFEYRLRPYRTASAAVTDPRYLPGYALPERWESRS